MMKLLATLFGLCVVAMGCGLLARDVQAQESLTVKKIRETGVISIGHRLGSVPFSYVDDKLKPIGYSMDLCYLVVDAIKDKLKLRSLQVLLTPVTPATRMPLVANGSIDLECGVTTNTLDRQKTVAFTVTTFVAAGRLLSPRTAPLSSVEDLKGKTVVSTVGTTNIQFLKELNLARGLDMKILAGKDDAESFLMLETHRAAAYAMDDVLLRSLVAMARNPADFTMSDDNLTVEPYAIALSKDDPPFKSMVDDILVGIFKSGEIETIYRKWFQSPIPPRGINLQLPMNPALKKAIATPTDSGNPADYR